MARALDFQNLRSAIVDLISGGSGLVHAWHMSVEYSSPLAALGSRDYMFSAKLLLG